ncbi:hypothetical protein D9M68_364860 [compost metagenome]
MDPITPLGKPLSQGPLVNPNVPLQPSVPDAGEAPISAFQWISLVRATWTWLLKPLWYLCFKWPSLIISTSAVSRGGNDNERRRRDADNAERADWEQRYKTW